MNYLKFWAPPYSSFNVIHELFLKRKMVDRDGANQSVQSMSHQWADGRDWTTCPYWDRGIVLMSKVISDS